MGVYEKVKGSGVWWVQWFEHGQRRRKMIGKKSLASQYYEKMRAQVRDEQLFPEHRLSREANKRLGITVADLVDRYAESTRATVANWKHLERYRAYWKAAYGDVPLRGMTPEMVESYRVRRLREDVKPSTVNKEVQRLHRLFNLAIRDKLFSGLNPVGEVKKLREDPGRIRYLADEEERRLREVSLLSVFWHGEARGGALAGWKVRAR